MQINKLLRVVVAVLFLVAPGAGAAPVLAQTTVPDPAPTCRLFDARSRPANVFAHGDRLVVRGAEFPPGAAVVVTFDQLGESTELSQVRADASGAVSTSATDTTVPRAAEPGPAMITLSDGVNAGTCLVTITPATGRRSTVGYAIWIAVLLVFGAFLGAASFRRWRHARLESAIAELPQDTDGRTPVSTSWSGADNDRPLLDDRSADDDDEEWQYTDADEPPVLPDSSEEGFEPRRPQRTSPAVTRLLREAKEWAED